MLKGSEVAETKVQEARLKRINIYLTNQITSILDPFYKAKISIYYVFSTELSREPVSMSETSVLVLALRVRSKFLNNIFKLLILYCISATEHGYIEYWGFLHVK